MAPIQRGAKPYGEDRTVMQDHVVYAVKDWDKHYESAETRKLKSLPRVLVPVKHDGKGFRRIMRQTNGPQIYAAWILILQIAAKCPKRGVLEDDDGPLTPEDMELKTDCPASVFEEALEFLSRPEVGWVLTQVVNSRSDFGRSSGRPPDTSGDDGRLAGATEENGTEGKRSKSLSVPDQMDCPAFEAGSHQVRSDDPKRSSVFDAFFKHPERLKDPNAVRDWVRWQATQPVPVIPEPKASDFAKVVEAAKKCACEAENPPAYFASLIGRKRREKAKNG